MSAECPFCRRSVDSRAVICPHCTSDLRYPERVFAPPPRTARERWQRTQSRARGVGWELFARLLFVAPLAVLIGLPLIPVVVVVAGIIFLWAVVAYGLGAGASGATSGNPTTSPAVEPEVHSANGVRWTPRRNSKRFPHVCWNCQTGCERRVAVCPQCGFGGFNGEGPDGARRE